jgi:hypothetical protein
VSEIGHKRYGYTGPPATLSSPLPSPEGQELSGTTIAKVQKWLGHANIATTRLYDRRETRPEDSPTLR